MGRVGRLRFGLRTVRCCFALVQQRIQAGGKRRASCAQIWLLLYFGKEAGCGLQAHNVAVRIYTKFTAWKSGNEIRKIRSTVTFFEMSWYLDNKYCARLGCTLTTYVAVPLYLFRVRTGGYLKNANLNVCSGCRRLFGVAKRFHTNTRCSY